MQEYKVVVLGDKGVGKTCLVLRFIEGYYTAKQQSTIGAFFLTKRMTLESGQSFKMQLWDTAGQERFRAMAPMYYRNAAAAIVCFDITSEESFTKMKDWIQELQQNVPGDGLVLAIACNKSDLEEKRTVPRLRAEQFATKVNALIGDTSAKDNLGIDDLFNRLSIEITSRRGTQESAAGGGGGVVIGSTAPKNNKNDRCC